MNKKYILLVVLVLFIVSVPFIIINNIPSKEIEEIEIDNSIDYSEIETLNLDLHSKGYLLIRLNDFKALYGEKYDRIMYPASLTKVVTMNTVLNTVKNLDDTSYFTKEQYTELIKQNASVAGLTPNANYSIKDLLYYLILPSGADAAIALENYFQKNGLNLIDEMNKRCSELGLEKSHFTNSTGLHDDNLYTTLKDLSIVYIDTLNNNLGKQILKTTYSSQLDLYSSFYSFTTNRDDDILIYGGKTGYTDESRQDIIIFYEADNRSYILLLYGADGNPGRGEKYHFDDANMILDYLYN